MVGFFSHQAVGDQLSIHCTEEELQFDKSGWEHVYASLFANVILQLRFPKSDPLILLQRGRAPSHKHQQRPDKILAMLLFLPSPRGWMLWHLLPFPVRCKLTVRLNSQQQRCLMTSKRLKRHPPRGLTHSFLLKLRQRVSQQAMMIAVLLMQRIPT